MAEHVQWVNLPAGEGKWLGEGVAHRNQLGPDLRLSILLEGVGSGRATIQKRADSENAEYSDSEKPRSVYYRSRNWTRRVPVREFPAGDLALEGPSSVIIEDKLNAAGGDEYTYSVDFQGSTEEVTVKTRRKLYFQVMRLRGVSDISANVVRGFKREFWNARAKTYVKFVQLPSPGPGHARTNIRPNNQHDSDWACREVRRMMDDSKQPNCIFILLAKYLAGVAIKRIYSAPLTVAAPHTDLVITSPHTLAKNIIPGSPWIHEALWIPDGGGARQEIDVDHVQYDDTYHVHVNTRHLGAGMGRVRCKVSVVDRACGGWSYPSYPLIIMASRQPWGDPYPTDKQVYILRHEVGHALRMVPGTGSTSDLDRQPYQYRECGHQGPHCRWPITRQQVVDAGGEFDVSDNSAGALVGDCTMFGDTRAVGTRFCRHCRTSLRKTEMRGSGIPGLSSEIPNP